MSIIYLIIIILNSFSFACVKPYNSTFLSETNCSWICNPGFININNECVIQYSIYDSYPISPFGFQILQIYYNISCLLHGCWVINIAYTKNSNGIVALYLPNNNINNNIFPCNNYNLSSYSSTSCCLNDFINNYHVISTFEIPYNNTCYINNPPILNNQDAIYGKFNNMSTSLVQNYLITDDNSIIKTAQILLDENELITSSSSIFTGTIGIYENYDLFIGLAEFINTNTRILESSYNQIKLSLTKTDYLVFSTYGIDTYTFIKYINVVINNFGFNKYYATISFTIDNNFEFMDIPTTYILIQNIYPCNMQLPTDYISSSCSPNIKFCSFNTFENYININVPLLNININNNIFINFIVKANDIINNEIIYTTLNSEIPIISTGIINLCSPTQSSQVNFNDFIESINLIIGIAGNQNYYNTLRSYNNISSIKSTNSESIESGLLTLIIKGQDSYFNLIGNQDYSLNLNDMIILYITDIIKYNQVMLLFNNTIPINIININNNPSLQLSNDLLQICNVNPNQFPQSSCVYNHDIKSTTFQINNNDPSRFIEKIFNTNNNYIYNLASNFSNLIINQYDLINNTSKYRKAFWINPGFNWIGAGINGANRFTLSQMIIVISLININKNSSSRRLLSIDKYIYNNQYNIQYGITSESIIASNLNINLNLVTTWDVKMNFTCININNIQEILFIEVSDCSSPILELGIVSINNNNNCVDGIIIVRFILAFANSVHIFFDLQKFINEPNIISIEPVNIINTTIIRLNNSYDNNINSNKYNYNTIIYITSIILGIVLISTISILYYKIYINKNKKDDLEKCESAIIFNNYWKNNSELPNWISKQ